MKEYDKIVDRFISTLWVELGELNNESNNK